MQTFHKRSTVVAIVITAIAIVSVVHLSVNAQGIPLEGADVRSGRAVYIANCAACHQLAGTGVKAAVPSLVGNVPTLMAQIGGREYLVNALLNGISGELTVDGMSYEGIMPSWRHLSDSQLADILNYISFDWGNAARLKSGAMAFTPSEVVSARANFLSSRAVAESRPTGE